MPERILYEDVITYPAVRQDLAFVVAEDVPAGELVAGGARRRRRELREARVFDVYRGEQIPEGRKSVALRVAFQSPERTLSDEDAQVLRERIVAALAERFGAELRASAVTDPGRRALFRIGGRAMPWLGRSRRPPSRARPGPASAPARSRRGRASRRSGRRSRLVEAGEPRRAIWGAAP